MLPQLHQWPVPKLRSSRTGVPGNHGSDPTESHSCPRLRQQPSEGAQFPAPGAIGRITTHYALSPPGPRCSAQREARRHRSTERTPRSPFSTGVDVGVWRFTAARCQSTALPASIRERWLTVELVWTTKSTRWARVLTAAARSANSLQQQSASALNPDPAELWRILQPRAAAAAVCLAPHRWELLMLQLL